MGRISVYRNLRRFAVVASCAALASLGALPLQSAEAAPAAAKTTPGHFAPYPGGALPAAESGNITAGSCTYRQAVDNPHVTAGESSVHGWWINAGGTCPSKANVDVYLQGYWCDGFGCSWITVADGSGDYYAGGGSGRRANARRACSGTSTVGWRGYVDVDLIGVNDPSGYTYGTIVNLSCVP